MSRAAHLCEHANEVPQACPCPSDCYCRSHTCKPRDDRDPPRIPRLVTAVMAGVSAAVAGWAVPALDVVNALRTLHGMPRVASVEEHDAQVAAARTRAGG